MLTPEQQRVIDKVMEEMTAEGWEPDPELQEAVYDALFTGRGEWNGMVIEVSWDGGQVQ